MESGHEPTVVTLYNDLSMVAEAIRALAQTLRDREAFVSKDQLSGMISSMLVTQQQLAAAAKAMETLAQQNPVVQGELMEARTALVKALQKTMMAQRPQQQQPDAGQGQ